jgi:hypothetical protein
MIKRELSRQSKQKVLSKNQRLKKPGFGIIPGILCLKKP